MFDGKPILIVEDEAMIALCLSLAVEDLNGQVVGPVATVREALELLETATIAAAVLDANLADRDVTPVALHLVERKVPFVIHTGTWVPPDLAALHPDLPVLMKPLSPTVVLARLREEMEAGPPRG